MTVSPLPEVIRGCFDDPAVGPRFRFNPLPIFLYTSMQFIRQRPSQTPDEFYYEFIAEKKRIEYEYARPYLSPVADPAMETEADLRERVRAAILNDLSEEDLVRLNATLSNAQRSLMWKHDLI